MRSVYHRCWSSHRQPCADNTVNGVNQLLTRSMTRRRTSKSWSREGLLIRKYEEDGSDLRPYSGSVLRIGRMTKKSPLGEGNLHCTRAPARHGPIVNRDSPRKRASASTMLYRFQRLHRSNAVSADDLLSISTDILGGNFKIMRRTMVPIGCLCAGVVSSWASSMTRLRKRS